MKAIETIEKFFSLANQDYIGEPVSQIEHALQSAYFADQSRQSDEVVIASLLHDIGHFASDSKQNTMSHLGIVQHEWIGAMLAYALNVSPKVALLIGYHVDAKRYLAAKKPLYYERLSDASKKTLAFQGGPMCLTEMRVFESLPYFREILQVRINDEKAKEVNLTVPNLDFYLPRIAIHIAEQTQILKNPFIVKDYISVQEIAAFKEYVALMHI